MAKPPTSLFQRGFCSVMSAPVIPLASHQLSGFQGEDTAMQGSQRSLLLLPSPGQGMRLERGGSADKHQKTYMQMI